MRTHFAKNLMYSNQQLCTCTSWGFVKAMVIKAPSKAIQAVSLWCNGCRKKIKITKKVEVPAISSLRDREGERVSFDNCTIEKYCGPNHTLAHHRPDMSS